MKGRKPLPTEVKKLKGTARKSRVLKDELPALKIGALPEPPMWLDKIGREEWRHTVESLDRLGVLSKTDLALLAIYCNEVSVYIETEKILRDKTRVHLLFGDDGKVIGTRVVAYQRIADNALKKLLALAAEFGFTPSARTRIGLSTQREQPNRAATLIRRAK